MQDFEKLGAFYLGRPYALERKASGDGYVLYDSRDLVTHGAIIGMTGSGKTGLAIGLLEEAAIDGIPAIAVDPKGDLANLLLTFPDLSPASFKPWVSADEAARQGMDLDAFAAREAGAWKAGLAGWGQDGARIQKLNDAVDVAVYTPGSGAGLSVSVLRSFDAPPAEIVEDHELFAEQVASTVSGVLTLAGLEADPVKGREHILLSTILGAAWRNGETLDLGGLIQRVLVPPVTKVGVLDLDAFYPPQQRFELALALNNLIASPGFQSWVSGEPLDVGRLLFTAGGRPRLSIVSIAHLSDAERMFFVSMLFGQVVAWMRRQSGTTSLRAILYMDEVAGYVPPHPANPPSKTPLLTLLKQARAFGLGVVLATQNPVDLDYKALSNIGTWFLGRLQTERDKLRVLDGLEGTLSGAGQFDRATMDRTLSGLGKRVFLLHNVHESRPEVFETRWTLSYLAGPLTREQIRTLMAPRKAAAPADSPVVAAAPVAPAPVTPPIAAGSAAAEARPVLPPDVPQYFVPARTTGPVRYAPRLFCVGSVQFVDTRLDLNESRSLAVLATITDGLVAVAWDTVQPTDVALGDLDHQPEADATFESLPAAAVRARNYAAWEKEFGRWLFTTQTLDLMREAESKLVSRPGESEGDFRVRVQHATREARDAAKQKLEQKYAPKLAQITERLRRAEQAAAREAQQATDSKVQAGFSILATGIGALFGRKTLSATNLGKAASAARSASRVMKESGDVGRAKENVAALQAQLQELDARLHDELAALETAWAPSSRPIDAVSIKPKKTSVTVQRVVLAWIPVESERR